MFSEQTSFMREYNVDKKYNLSNLNKSIFNHTVVIKHSELSLVKLSNMNLDFNMFGEMFNTSTVN